MKIILLNFFKYVLNMEKYLDTFLEIAFIIVLMMFLFYINILHNNPFGIILSYLFCINSIVIKILILLDGDN